MFSSGLKYEQGVPMPSDHQLYAPNDLYAPQMPNTYSTHPPSPSALPPSRRPSSPNMQHLSLNDRSVAPPVPMRGPSPVFGGYAQLPNHHEDMRRLTDECTAAKESARVLAEALVFTRPEELAQKPVIQVSLRRDTNGGELIRFAGILPKMLPCPRISDQPD